MRLYTRALPNYTRGKTNDVHTALQGDTDSKFE